MDPDIRINVNVNSDTGAFTQPELVKLVTEAIKRGLGRTRGQSSEPAHEHRFDFLRQERHKDTGEIQDVLYCPGCCQFRFRLVGPFRPYTPL